MRNVDLNLLVTFLALMRERSVSRAARRLHLGQPAVSGALARLRDLFGDPLLIRTPKGMTPTARALALETQLVPAMERIQSAVFEPRVFEPARSDRTFILGMPDWVELWLAPALFARVHELAPRVRIAIKATDPFEANGVLERNEMDAGVGRAVEGPGWRRERMLRSLRFRCVYPSELVRGNKGLSLKEYTRHPHLLVSYRGVFESAVDEYLATQGLRREVRYSTSRFAAIPGILLASSAIATVPEVLADQWQTTRGLQVCELPFPLPEFPVSSIWQATQDSDPGLQWLLGLVEGIAVGTAQDRR